MKAFGCDAFVTLDKNQTSQWRDAARGFVSGR
jgi:hypothetical protein